MKQVVMFTVLAFVVSLGGTTGYLVKSYKPPVIPEAVVDTASDSTEIAATHVDSIQPESVATRLADTVHAAPAGEPAVPTGEAVPPVRQGEPAADPVARDAAYKQVARVLSAMKPVEAAKVIAFLSDDEVEGLLRSVGPRQAADFLTNVPKERAAMLSRRLLRPRMVGVTR